MEKILTAVRIGTWNGIVSYLYDWGYTSKLIRQETAENLLRGIAANLETSDQCGLCSRLIAAGYGDGDEVRLNAYNEVNEGGELYEVHEITIGDCQRAINQAMEA